MFRRLMLVGEMAAPSTMTIIAAVAFIFFSAIALPHAGADSPSSHRESFKPMRVVSEARFCKTRLEGQFWMKTELYFGLSNQSGEISQEEFERFIDNYVTPRFPDGLTYVPATGRFLGSSGSIIAENSRILILLYPFSAHKSAEVDAIREDFRIAFQQESVLRVDEKSCISF